MVSSITSIIWGGSTSDQDGPSPPTTTINMRDDSLDEDDWVVVGRIAQFPGTLVGTFPLPESDTTMMVSPALSEIGDVEKEISEPLEAAQIKESTEKQTHSKDAEKDGGERYEICSAGKTKITW